MLSIDLSYIQRNYEKIQKYNCIADLAKEYDLTIDDVIHLAAGVSKIAIDNVKLSKENERLKGLELFKQLRATQLKLEETQKKLKESERTINNMEKCCYNCIKKEKCKSITGRWVLKSDKMIDGLPVYPKLYCSVCNKTLILDSCYNYCPHCGAKMENGYDR